MYMHIKCSSGNILLSRRGEYNKNTSGDSANGRLRLEEVENKNKRSQNNFTWTVNCGTQTK